MGMKLVVLALAVSAVCGAVVPFGGLQLAGAYSGLPVHGAYSGLGLNSGLVHGAYSGLGLNNGLVHGAFSGLPVAGAYSGLPVAGAYSGLLAPTVAHTGYSSLLAPLSTVLLPLSVLLLPQPSLPLNHTLSIPVPRSPLLLNPLNNTDMSSSTRYIIP